MSAEFSDILGTKSFDDIVSDTLQAIVDKDVGLSNINPGSVLRTLVEVLAENEDMSNYYIEYVYNVMNIDNCEGDDLDRSVKILGLIRESAKPAVGEITLYTGDQPAEYDIEIPYGFIVSTRPDNDGNVKEFYISESKILRAGESSIDVAVTCQESGMIYIPAGSIDTLSKSLQGIHSVINQHAINGGRDTENDEEFRERIKNVRETFGKCTDEAIESAVNEVAGVTRARVIDMYKGVGTTGVMVITDTVPPPESVKNNIIKVVDNVKASGIKPFIVYTEVKNVNIDITINVSSSDYPSIVEAINKYCVSLGAGQTLLIRQLERKILNSVDSTVAENDDVDITTNLPADNVTCTEEQIIRVGTITINGEKIVE